VLTAKSLWVMWLLRTKFWVTNCNWQSVRTTWPYGLQRLRLWFRDTKNILLRGITVRNRISQVPRPVMLSFSWDEPPAGNFLLKLVLRKQARELVWCRGEAVTDKHPTSTAYRPHCSCLFFSWKLNELTCKSKGGNRNEQTRNQLITKAETNNNGYVYTDILSRLIKFRLPF